MLPISSSNVASPQFIPRSLGEGGLDIGYWLLATLPHGNIHKHGAGGSRTLTFQGNRGVRNRGVRPRRNPDAETLRNVVFEIDFPQSFVRNYGKTAERKSEKLPNGNWKNCRTGIDGGRVYVI